MRDGTLLIQNGCLVDPPQGYHGAKKDILIEDGLFSKIEDHIPSPPGIPVLDVQGAYVAPGFIDIHTHVFQGANLGLPADMIGITQGTTTVVDAGSAGPATIGRFIEEDIKPSRTRVYSAMHYATDGLMHPPEADHPSKYDLETGKAAYAQHAPYIVAIKARASNSCVGELGIESIKAGKALARAAGLPLLVHIGHMPPTIENVLDLLDKGDIITHAFHGKDNNLLENGTIKPQTQSARERGVIFDVGHGRASFNLNTGKLAKGLAFYPDVISTDLHTSSFHSPVHSLSETMSKFLALGYSLEFCVEKVTAAPAAYLALENLGKLKPGCWGDVTVFHMEKGNYTFEDADHNILSGQDMIVPDYAVVGGTVEMDSQSTFRQLCHTAKVPQPFFSDYEYIAKTILEHLSKQGVIFSSNHTPSFLNHIITMLERLRTQQKLEPLDPAMFAQIDPRVLSITNQIIPLAEHWYGSADDAERLLVAIHIQAAMNPEQFL